MKAMVCDKYGPPTVLQLQEVETPAPKDDQLLVKIHAASANALDWHTMRGEPFMSRLMGTGLLAPKSKILGADLAGRVESIGKNVARFQPGDEVFADTYWCGFGGFAEYAAVPEYAAALKPANLTFAEAASAPQGVITALHSLRDQGHLQRGQKVLINGASGAVGTFSVQVAKWLGGEVAGVCSGRNVEMVRSLGADHVIDYTREDFTQNGERYDLIVDNAASRSLSEYQRALTPGGTYVMVGYTLSLLLQVLFLGPWLSRRENVNMGLLSPTENRTDMDDVKTLLESGNVVPVIDKQYPLSQLPDAIRYLEEGHAKGKVVITVTHNGAA